MNNKLTPHILVAEDDKLYAKVYQNKLTKEGYTVSIATDGIEALKMAKESVPDLMLLDLIMPELDGFQVLKRLKDDLSTKDIRVLVMSNLGQPSDIDKAKELGAEEYFVKSNVSIMELMDKIKFYVGERIKTNDNLPDR